MEGGGQNPNSEGRNPKEIRITNSKVARGRGESRSVLALPWV